MQIAIARAEQRGEERGELVAKSFDLIAKNGSVHGISPENVRLIRERLPHALVQPQHHPVTPETDDGDRYGSIRE